MDNKRQTGCRTAARPYRHPVGVRAALATGALLLAPTLVLFARAVHHHGIEPELASADRV